MLPPWPKNNAFREKGQGSASTTKLPGGFHDYSVDERLARPPLRKKWSYDTPSCCGTISTAGRGLANPFLKETAERKLHWWVEPGSLRQANGGFLRQPGRDYSLDDRCGE